MTNENQRLAREFEEELTKTYIDAKKNCKYNATRFRQMLGELGGVATANKLMTTSSITQSGLAELWKCGCLDISVEAKVLLPQYRALFNDAVRDIARERLKAHEFDIDAWLKKVRGGAS